MENSLDVEKAEHKEEIKRRNEAIKGLKKELDTANDLIKTMKNKGLTEDDVERLSPSAAAASKLLKGGITLTQGPYSLEKHWLGKWLEKGSKLRK